MPDPASTKLSFPATGAPQKVQIGDDGEHDIDVILSKQPDAPAELLWAWTQQPGWHRFIVILETTRAGKENRTVNVTNVVQAIAPAIVARSRHCAKRRFMLIDVIPTDDELSAATEGRFARTSVLLAMRALRETGLIGDSTLKAPAARLYFAPGLGLPSDRDEQLALEFIRSSEQKPPDPGGSARSSESAVAPASCASEPVAPANCASEFRPPRSPLRNSRTEFEAHLGFSSSRLEGALDGKNAQANSTSALDRKERDDGQRKFLGNVCDFWGKSGDCNDSQRSADRTVSLRWFEEDIWPAEVAHAEGRQRLTEALRLVERARSAARNPMGWLTTAIPKMAGDREAALKRSTRRSTLPTTLIKGVLATAARQRLDDPRSDAVARLAELACSWDRKTWLRQLDAYERAEAWPRECNGEQTAGAFPAGVGGQD